MLELYELTECCFSISPNDYIKGILNTSGFIKKNPDFAIGSNP